MKIKYKTNFRYVLDSNFDSNNEQLETKDINIYNIKSEDGKCYKIIDTPGLGNVDDFKEDKNIFDKIYNLFKEKIDSINAICFAMKNIYSFNYKEQYVFNTILNLFGEELKNNFIIINTFCPPYEEPRNIYIFKEYYNMLIPESEEPLFYQFNNVNLLLTSNNFTFEKKCWKMGYKNFHNIIQKLEKFDKKYLYQSIEVINKIKNLDGIIDNLQEKLNNIKKSGDFKNGINECLKSHDTISETINRLKTIALNKKFVLSNEYELIFEWKLRNEDKKNLYDLRNLKNIKNLMIDIYKNKKIDNLNKYM